MYMHMQQINDGWQLNSRRQRLLAAACAIVLTAWFGLQMNRGRTYWLQRGLPEQSAALSYLSIFNVPQPAKQPENIADKAGKAETGHPNNRLPLARAATVGTGVAADAPVPDIPAGAPASAGQSIEPSLLAPVAGTLQLDGKTIAGAYKDSRSDMQKMAEAAGKTVEVRVSTQKQKFDAAMQEAAVPDCLAQGEDPMKHTPPQLGSVRFSGLLVLPFYVKAIATGKCK